MTSRRDRAIWFAAGIGLVAVVVAVIITIAQSRDGDDEPAAGPTTTTTAAPEPATPTTTNDATTAPPPASSTTTTATTSPPPPTTAATTTTLAPVTAPTVPVGPFATVAVRPDGVYLDATRLLDGLADTAFGWTDGTIVFQRPAGAVEVRMPDGAVTSFDPVGGAVLAGAGTVDGRRVVLSVTEEPMSEGGIDFLALRLWWHDLDSGDVGDLGIVAGFESGWSSISASGSAVGIGWVGEGFAGLSLLDLDGAPVPTGMPLDFEFDAFATPWLAPDGGAVASHDRSRIEVWDVATGTVEVALDLPPSSTLPAIVGFDGEVVYLVVDDGAATVAVAVGDGTVVPLGSGTVRPLLALP